MPRPLPPSLAESLPNSTEINSVGTSDIVRTLGGIGLPGDQSLNRMNPNGNSPEADGASWEVLTTARSLAQEIFGVDFVIPDTSALEKEIDLTKLKDSFLEYAQAGLKPELLLAPINLSLDTWKETYSRLCTWQDLNHADSTTRLQRRGDGDGLYINANVATNWMGLIQQSVTNLPGNTVMDAVKDGVMWKVLVVPTASKDQGGLAVNTNHTLTTRSDELTVQETAADTTATQVSAHMPIGAYLTMQAVRIIQKKPLLDSNLWTWNAGTFHEGANLRAPASRWLPGYGQVRVRHGGVGYSGDDLGVRLPVWG